MSDLNLYPSTPVKALKADILSTDLVARLRDIVWYTTSDGTDTNLTSADFGDTGFGVFEPRTERQEFFTWDPTTIANATTTGITLVLRGLKPGANYTTEVSGLKFNHPSGSKVILMTNAPGFYNDFANKDNNETITQVWTYSATPVISNAPVAGTDAANKTYVDGVAVAGAPDGSTTVKGIFEEATVAEQGTATATGATGARLIPANANLVKTSSGAGDENKIPVLDATGTLANGFIDKARTWTTVQSFTADNAQITTDADSNNDAVRKAFLDSQLLAKFYGDGSDGAFSQAAGTTTLNTAGKNIYQYTSFALTGTASLTTGANLDGKPLYIFVQGDLTITSATAPAVHRNGKGATGGGGGAAGSGGGVAGAAGGIGTISNFAVKMTASTQGTGQDTSGGGGGGGAAGLGNNGSDGVNGGGGSNKGLAGTKEFYDSLYTLSRLVELGFSGGGGGGGAGGAGATGGVGGVGGAGGGSVIFIVGGNINITSTFEAKGEAGAAGGNSAGYGAGGGGGGGGGFLGVFYAGSVTANTATFTVTAGAAGSGGTGPTQGGGAGGAGGAGQSLVQKIKSWAIA